MVILLIIVFLQFKLAVMHQHDHFVCLYLKTWRVGFLLFPSSIPFKFQNFVNSGPAQFQQVLQKIIGCRTYVLHIEFFFLKSVKVCFYKSYFPLLHAKVNGNNIHFVHNLYKLLMLQKKCYLRFNYPPIFYRVQISISKKFPQGPMVKSPGDGHFGFPIHTKIKRLVEDHPVIISIMLQFHRPSSF